MRITECESWHLRVPFTGTSKDFVGAENELIGVWIRTADGVTGTGFTFTHNFYGGTSIRALIDEVLVPRLIGRSLLDWRRLWTEFRHVTHRLGNGVNLLAMSAVDIAIWDALARTSERSLASMLGQVRDTIPAYGSGKASPLLSTAELTSLAHDQIESGLGGVKLRVGAHPDSDVERVAAVREALGPNVDLMVDANERLDVLGALELGRRLEPYGLLWFEEPLDSADVAGHRHLAESLRIPIAVGEHLISRWDFLPYIRSEAARVLQPDVCMVGGVTEFMRVGELACANGFSLAPHFLPELHVHLGAAFDCTRYVEVFPFLEFYSTAPTLEIAEGEVAVPEVLGHGIEFEDWVFNKFGVDRGVGLPAPVPSDPGSLGV